jgi:hypothetical protein
MYRALTLLIRANESAGSAATHPRDSPLDDSTVKLMSSHTPFPQYSMTRPHQITRHCELTRTIFLVKTFDKILLTGPSAQEVSKMKAQQSETSALVGTHLHLG